MKIIFVSLEVGIPDDVEPEAAADVIYHHAQVASATSLGLVYEVVGYDYNVES